MKKQNIRTLALIACTFTYLLIGAAVFDALEAANETAERTGLEEVERQFKVKYNISEEDYRNISHTIVFSQPHKAGVQWQFAGSFFFATTVITTIGYGHSTPKTIGGKVFCMLYALAGIPLNLVMFQSLGERLNILVTYLLRSIKKCLHFKNTDVSQTHLILISMNMSSLVVIGGAWAFSHYEEWTYLDSFYYCVITLTTVGFGDYVVLQKNNSLQDKPEYVVFAILFILFGLAVVSAAMNLLVLRFLTMNTQDERRDELQAVAATMSSSLRLDGDVITVNGSIVSGLHQQCLNSWPSPADPSTVYPSLTRFRMHAPGPGARSLPGDLRRYDTPPHLPIVPAVAPPPRRLGDCCPCVRSRRDNGAESREAFLVRNTSKSSSSKLSTRFKQQQPQQRSQQHLHLHHQALHHRYKVTRSPASQVTHLLQTNNIGLSTANNGYKPVHDKDLEQEDIRQNASCSKLDEGTRNLAGMEEEGVSHIGGGDNACCKFASLRNCEAPDLWIRTDPQQRYSKKSPRTCDSCTAEDSEKNGRRNGNFVSMPIEKCEAYISGCATASGYQNRDFTNADLPRSRSIEICKTKRYSM